MLTCVALHSCSHLPGGSKTDQHLYMSIIRDPQEVYMNSICIGVIPNRYHMWQSQVEIKLNF